MDTGQPRRKGPPVGVIIAAIVPLAILLSFVLFLVVRIISNGM